jgi:60 kDa SS-A/Ro ribonucleoprotein
LKSYLFQRNGASSKLFDCGRSLGTMPAIHGFIMANASTFRSFIGKLLPKATAQNAARSLAYSLPPKHALAQYAATGCFNSTFYASAAEQLDKIAQLTNQVDPVFVAKTAVYCRERALMKDTPAYLCALLASAPAEQAQASLQLGKVFGRVLSDGKMLRNFVQMIRSGKTGRKSFGTKPKRLITAWFDARTDDEIFYASVGQSPSLTDVIKMVHPKPESESRRALYGYLLGRMHDASKLPPLVQAFEAFKSGASNVVPNVPFQMLTALPLSSAQWVAIACNASWQTTRMNLATFARHGVFDVPVMAEVIAKRLRDPEAIRKARVFPYQLLAAYRSASASGVPGAIVEALQDAMELSLANVPAMSGKVYVLVDVSGSMASPITGHRAGATTSMRCIDGAALVAAAILRKNPTAEVIPFEHEVNQSVHLNPRDTVMTNADKLASIGGGGTNCSAPLAWLNAKQAKGDAVIMVSDNESWVDNKRRGATAMMHEWDHFKARNPKARLVCLDFVPNATTQAQESSDILNIGGFSDAVFDLLASFTQGTMNESHWVGEIEAIAL